MSTKTRSDAANSKRTWPQIAQDIMTTYDDLFDEYDELTDELNINESAPAGLAAMGRKLPGERRPARQIRLEMIALCDRAAEFWQDDEYRYAMWTRRAALHREDR